MPHARHGQLGLLLVSLTGLFQVASQSLRGITVSKCYYKYL